MYLIFLVETKNAPESSVLKIKVTKNHTGFKLRQQIIFIQHFQGTFFALSKV